MSDVLLKVENLSKMFCMSPKRSILYGTLDVTRDMIGFYEKNIRLRTSEFWALRSIKLNFKKPT